MNKAELYCKLPKPLKSLAASLWGYYLRWWRYSGDTEKLVEEALEREYWSEQEWEFFKEEKLELLLHKAVNHVPYYRDYWSQRRRHGDRSSWKILSNWPILTKDQLRKNIDGFIADDCNINLMYPDHTGGTTGTPLTIYQSRKTVQYWYSIYEARLRRWHQVSYSDPWAIFGGQIVTPLNQTEPPFWVENKGLNQLYLSTFHISPENIQAYAKKIDLFKPTHLIVYPSSAVEFAKEIISQNIKIWQPQVVITNAEPLSEQQRIIISQAFQCDVFSTYGMGEIVFGASECKHHTMHSWPESGILEVLDENYQPVSKNSTGSLVITGLINQDMPLIRYDIGDRGLSEKTYQCECGRTLPNLPAIEGRSSDMLQTQDGRKVFWLNPVFYDLNVLQGQIIQEEADKIFVYIVPDEGFKKSEINEIVNRLHKRVGDEMHISVKEVATLEHEKNGKVRPVISRIN